MNKNSKNISNIIETKYGSNYFDFAMDLIFKEWGDGNLEHLKEKKDKLKNNTNRFCYVLEINSSPVGCFSIYENDIKGYEKFNPNLACVCIDEKYRGLGYSKILMNYVDDAFKNLNIKTAYLKTSLVNFYEKFGWKFVENIENNEKVFKKTFD